MEIKRLTNEQLMFNLQQIESDKQEVIDRIEEKKQRILQDLETEKNAILNTLELEEMEIGRELFSRVSPIIVESPKVKKLN